MLNMAPYQQISSAGVWQRHVRKMASTVKYDVLLLNNWDAVEEPTHFEHGPLSADFQCWRLAAPQSQDGVDSEKVVLCAPLSRNCVSCSSLQIVSQ